jgi:hypothetical protein
VIIQIDAAGFALVAIPLKDHPPLFVHADRMKTVQLAAQLLEVIAGRNT